jgi:hypothetical protein
MRRIAIISCIVAGMGAGFWQCSDESRVETSLKDALYMSADKLNKALDDIQNSNGYNMLLADTQGSLKSTFSDSTVYFDSILLEDISGIYEYQRPDSLFYCNHGFYNLFHKTGESNDLIVKLPEERLFHPRRLRYPLDQDTSEQNNFVITASAYHYYFARGFIYDYNLIAGFELDDTPLGNLAIDSYRKSWNDFYFNSSYSFPEGYAIDVENQSGDTNTFSIALMDDSDVLLKEIYQSIKIENQRRHEHEYTLIIGNVMIKRYPSADSVEVYLNNVLQPDARVEIIETDDNLSDDAHSVCHKRDIQITFEDGTVTTVSELLGPSKDILGQLVGAIRDMYFSTRIIDYIAWNINWSNEYQ